MTYLWRKYNTVSTPIYGIELFAEIANVRLTNQQAAKYTTSTPPIVLNNGVLMFDFTNASSQKINGDNYANKYYSSWADVVRTEDDVSAIKYTEYCAVLTDRELGIIVYNRFKHHIYKPIIQRTEYSRGSYIGDVTSDSQTTYPADGRHTDGFWYVYAGIAYTNLYVKNGTAYSRVADVYKKVNGVYVKQTNIPALFPEGVKLRGGGVTLVNLIPTAASRTEGGWSAGSIDTAHVHSALGLTHSLKLTGASGAPESLSNCTEMMPQIQGHTYYWRIYEYHEDSALNGCSSQIYWPIAAPSMGDVSFGAAGQWNMMSMINVRSNWESANQSWRVDFNNNNLAGSVWYTGIMMIDLTAAYGAGNEPDKAWCDSNIPYFTGMTGG